MPCQSLLQGARILPARNAGGGSRTCGAGGQPTCSLGRLAARLTRTLVTCPTGPPAGGPAPWRWGAPLGGATCTWAPHLGQPAAPGRQPAAPAWHAGLAGRHLATRDAISHGQSCGHLRRAGGLSSSRGRAVQLGVELQCAAGQCSTAGQLAAQTMFYRSQPAGIGRRRGVLDAPELAACWALCVAGTSVSAVLAGARTGASRTQPKPTLGGDLPQNHCSEHARLVRGPP